MRCGGAEPDMGREQVRHERGNSHLFSRLCDKTPHHCKVEDAVDSSPEDKLHEKFE